MEEHSIAREGPTPTESARSAILNFFSLKATFSQIFFKFRSTSMDFQLGCHEIQKNYGGVP